MREIKFRAWIAREVQSKEKIMNNEVCLFAKKPKLRANGRFDLWNVAWTEKILDITLQKFHAKIKRGECKKVEIIIRETK